MATAETRVAPRTFFARHSLGLVCLQGLLVFCSLCFAWLLRFDFSLPYRVMLLATAPILIIIRLWAMSYFRLLHGWWRYTGLKDILDILKAIVLGSVAFYFVIRVVFGMTHFPRSIYILEALVSAALLMGVRTFCRVFAESVRKKLTEKRVVLIVLPIRARTVIRSAPTRWETDV